MCKAWFQNYLKMFLANINLSMKEPTWTEVSVILHKPESKEMGWGWCQIPLGLPKYVFTQGPVFCCCNSFLSPSVCMNKKAEGGMLDLHLAPNLPAILRCQPVSSSAPNRRVNVFKYQKQEDALVHCTPVKYISSFLMLLFSWLLLS